MGRLGSAVLGFPAKFQPVARADWWQVAAKQRRNELRKLVMFRYGRNLRHERYDIGPPTGWLAVLANLAICLKRETDAEAIADLAAIIGYRERIDAVLLEAIARDSADAAKLWRRYRLLTPDHVGKLLEVTSVERDEAGLLKIGSTEEGSAERNRRLDRERQAWRRRTSGSVPRAESEAATRPWEAMGISESTYRRQKKARARDSVSSCSHSLQG